jgi:hypothetical protein
MLLDVETLVCLAGVLDKPIAYFYPADSEADTAKEARLLELFRSVPQQWQDRMLQCVEDQARLRERVRPYERAGVPEEFYESLLWDEYETMQLEDYVSELESGEVSEPGSEEARLQQAFQDAYYAWKRHVDEQEERE